MIDWTKPIRTVDQHYPARVICTDRVLARYPIIVLIKSGHDRQETIAQCKTDGTTYSDRKIVENVPIQTSTFQNVYKAAVGAIYNVRDHAFGAAYADASYATLERVFTEDGVLIDIKLHHHRP